MTEARPVAVGLFVEALEEMRWELLEKALAEDVRRVALWYDESQEKIGKQVYITYLSTSPPGFHKWKMSFREVHVVDDGQRAFCVAHEEIQRTEDSDHITIDQLLDLTLDTDGLISRVDIFFKVTPRFAKSVLDRFGDRL